ncbi:MAG: FKBP-type peptidyl-prolyl cis-trans isomerase, partial [Candidatus Cryptobacteroides sp.]
MKKIYGYLGAAALISLAAGCARDASISSNEQTKTYLDSWVLINYPEAVESGAGIYILEDEPGSGKEYNGETYPMLAYTITGTEGTVSSTTVESVAKQVGTYVKGNYYGSKVWTRTEATMPIGVENMLEGMRVGGRRKVLIPSWLLGSTRYKNDEEYIKHSPSGTSTSIYDFTLTDFTDDITQWEIDSLERYVSRVYPGIDSTLYGFYFKEVRPAANDEEFSSDTTVYINYIGRLLNGQVFDTTIRDTAKKYGLYSSSNSYEPIVINWADDALSLTMTSDKSDMIAGFKQTLWRMKSHGRYTGLFTSDYGYSYSGSGSKIPPYAPLIFE